VARKVFQSRGDFHREIRILNEIRSSLSQHDRVALHLSTVTVGDEFHILSPVADMDLEKFLNGGHLPPDDFTMAELMQEAAKLAGALDILHDHLQGEHPRRFCHRDLKPANILVFLDRDSPDFPRVGKWKITDFGLSVINSQERPIPMEEFVTQTDNQQVWVEGAYQAPEVFQRTASGRRSDIWSFGCILVRILAFKLDGIQGLRKLDERRGKAADGVSNYVDDYFNRGEPRILNPHIEDWINGLPNRYEEYSEGFKEGCRKILLKMLKIDKEERPTASEVAFELQGLQQLSLVLRPRDDSISVHTSGSSTLPPRSSVSDPPSWPQSSGSNLRSCFTSSPEHLVSEIENHHEAGVQVILNGHVDVERNVRNDRPLIHAINHDFPEGVDQLLRYRQGVNIEKRDSKGNTPLGLAVKQGNLRIANLLLNAGACVNAVSQHGITPIMTAARNGDIIIFQTLLDRGADCTTYSEVGLTCLHYATYSETGADIIRILVAKKFNGADVPRKGSNGEMPLLTLIKNYADRDSWWERFGALINDGKADVNQGDVQGVTPLSLAVDEQNPRLFRRLIQLGASMEGIAIPRSLRTDMAEAVRWAQQQDHQGSRRRSRRMSSFLR
jgi:serine/threonine protein kinase